MCRSRSAQGFTLVELMLAALLGTFLCGVVFQLLFAETRHGGALAESLQLKQWQLRTLQLVKGNSNEPPAGRSIQIRPCGGPVPWLIGNRSSPSHHVMARIQLCTASDQRHRRSGAVMC